MNQKLESVIRDLAPSDPLEIVFPNVIEYTARQMLGLFPGRMLYAIKCNPKTEVLKAVWQGGIRHFDAASLDEIALVRGLFPTAHIAYMNPIKPRDDIQKAKDEFGVSTFAVDSMDELDKVVAQGGCDSDIIVRLALPKGQAGRDQSGKFGVSPDQAALILKAARKASSVLGITFHVGSQCVSPEAYATAMDMANDACQMSGVHVDVLDVGGGFPVPYLGCNPPPFSQFVDKIQAHSNGRAVWCEPGRALVAAGEALVVRVVSRKGDALFLNDGIYGGLAPAPLSGYRYASQLITNDGRTASTSKQSFQLFGPTCDSWDCLPVPYDLPVNCAEGDWIVMFGTGAYAGAIRTRFNGMGTARTLTLSS